MDNHYGDIEHRYIHIAAIVYKRMAAEWEDWVYVGLCMLCFTLLWLTLNAQGLCPSLGKKLISGLLSHLKRPHCDSDHEGNLYDDDDELCDDLRDEHLCHIDAGDP